jgi:phosphatidylinositol glycan class B
LGVFIAREEKVFLIKVSLSFLMIVGLGIIIDSFFYGEFVFTQFNYVYENIVNNKSQNYGFSPWYFYLEKIITFPTLIVGVPLMIALFTFCILKPKNLFVWITFFFILIHSLAGHKEERFLFPLIYYIPFVLAFFYERFFSKSKFHVISIIFLIIFSLINISLTVLVSTKGTGRGRLVIAKYLHDNFSSKDMDLILLKNSFLFEDPNGALIMNFYLQKNLNILYVNNICEMSALIKKSQNEVALVLTLGDLKKNACLNLENVVLLKESLPIKKEWISYLEAHGIKNSKLDKMLLLYKVLKINTKN